MLPYITIEGNLVDEPEVRFTPTGKQLAEFRVAASRSKRNERGEWVDDKELFIKVTVWDQLAENVAESLNKGDSVLVTGYLYQDSWEDAQGQRRTAVRIEGKNVGASLMRATARPQRVQRQPAQAQQARDPWAADPNARNAPAAAPAVDPWAGQPENPPF
jgi:single-strand DNA-binding protein